MVINRRKTCKTLREVKLVENISQNLQSFLEISPLQKEVFTSHHSHTKRNSLDTQTVFMEFSEFVKNSVSGRLLRGKIFQNVFEDHQAGSGIEGISTF